MLQRWRCQSRCVQPRAQPAAELEERGCAGCAPPAPRLQAWESEPQEPGQGGEEPLARQRSHILPFPMARPALLGKREGPGSQQPRVRTSRCQSQLLAAIWAGAVPVSQICLPFGKGGENCAEKIASPSILRLSVKNPTKPAFEKGRDEKYHTLGSFQRNLLLLGLLHLRKVSICPQYPLVLLLYLVIAFTFKN